MMVQFISPAQKSRDINQWATHQVYIALGALLSTAAHLGIDACPMEGFIPDAYDQILGLTAKGYSATVLCTLGYRSSEDGYAKAPKVRYEQSEIISHV
jgi:nitroreductase